MSSSPVVTVGITSFNDDRGIRRCLQSVRDQSLPAEQIEVIIVDDGSTDQTLDEVNSAVEGADWAGLRIVEGENTGTPSTGRNMILTESAGEYVFFVDADDYLGPQALETMVTSAKSHGSDIVVGRYEGVNRSAPNVLGGDSSEEVRDYHAGWLNSLHVQKLFNTEFLRGLDYRFNERLIYASDHPFMISAFLHAQTVSFVNEVPCYYITLEEKSALVSEHVSRASITALKQFRFLHDCFGILAAARGRGGDLATRSGRMRADYWNRLLKLHIPSLLLRKKSSRGVEVMASEALYLAELYGAVNSRTPLVPRAQVMLRALETEDADTIVEIARWILEK